MTRIHVHGAYGRLGQVIAQLGEQASDISRSGRSDDLESLVKNCDVAIDVTQPEGTLAIAEICAAHGKPLVTGTTGHSESAIRRLRALSDQAAILVAPNFSVGTNVLFWLTEEATKLLGNDFDIEILELHHRQKKDAPSGTARRLGEIAARARSQEPNEVFRYGRQGLVGARKEDEIGIHAVRGGDIVGEHTVYFCGLGERLELSHRASTRETFARGALRAALWIVSRPVGWYDMRDVLGLS